MGKVLLQIPRRGEPVTRLDPLASTMRRVMTLESQVGLLSNEVQRLRHRTPEPLTPFQGWVDPANGGQIIVGAHRAEDWYPWLDTIYVQGTDLTLNKGAAETVAYDWNYSIYYAITVSVSPITAVLSAAETVPDDTDSLRHVVLGKYILIGAAHWYKQQHFGNIFVNPEYYECACVVNLDDLGDVEIP